MCSYVFNDYERLTFYDYILFIIIFIFPYLDNGVWYNVTHFIPLINSLGCQFLAFILSLYLWQYSARHHYNIISKSLYLMILMANIWTCIKLFQTISITGVREAMTVYRKNYILLPSFFLCMSYISNMSTFRMKLMFKLALKWILFTCVLYFMQCMGFSIFTSDLHTQTIKGISVVRNIIGLPQIIPVVFAFFFIAYLYDENKKNAAYVIIFFIVLFFSFTRNLIASAGIIVILAMILYIWKFGILNKYKLLFYAFIGIAFLTILFPKALTFWGSLIDSTINSQLVKEEGTYAFRERLIDNAVNTLERHQCLWTGFGYIRDAPKGEYSFVLGTDTYIAPILWCEGVIGIILRSFPCFFLLAKAWVYFRRYFRNIKGLLALVIITSVVSQIPNYVQTSIFVKFNYTFALLYMIFVYILKSEDEGAELNTI